MAHPTNSKDAVAASMKRRLNPDDYMSDPKKTSITWGDAEKNEPTRSYFHASNSLAQLRSRNPLPERYAEASGGKAYGGMVNIDGQQYYQPGILNKEDIAPRFESRGVNSKENNYGLRGEEDKFTGRADSSIASMSPDELRELVGGVAMRVEDAENKRYANMFLKIHDTVEKAPNMKEALHESNKLVPLGPDGVSMAADKGLSRFDIEAMGAVQRGALEDRYAREREAAERARLADVQRRSGLSEAEYADDGERRANVQLDSDLREAEKAWLADVQRSSGLSEAEYADDGNWQDDVQRNSDLHEAENAERRRVGDADRQTREPNRSEGEEVAGGGARDAPISLWDAHKKAAKGTLSGVAGYYRDPHLKGNSSGGPFAFAADAVKAGVGAPFWVPNMFRKGEEVAGGGTRDAPSPLRDAHKKAAKDTLSGVAAYYRDAFFEGTSSKGPFGFAADAVKAGVGAPFWVPNMFRKGEQGPTPVDSRMMVRAALERSAEKKAAGKEGTVKTNAPSSQKSQVVLDMVKEFDKSAATGEKGATSKKGKGLPAEKDSYAWKNAPPTEKYQFVDTLLGKIAEAAAGTDSALLEDVKKTNKLTPEQRKTMDNILKRVREYIELDKKDAAEAAPGEGWTEIPVEEEDPASYREASATHTPAKTNAPPSRSLPATAPYRLSERDRQEQEAAMEAAGRRNKQWDDLTKKLISKQDAKIEALMVEAEKKGLSKAEVESRWMDIHLLKDPESEAAFAPLMREKAKAQETERQRWAKIHAEIRRAKEQAKEQETDIDRYYTPRKISQLKAELTRRLNNANPLGGRPPLRRSGPRYPFGLDRFFPEAPPPNVSREQYVHGPYVDSANGRYVIGPEHPLFELEKQQQYRRGFVTKYNAEGGFYYTQFDRDLAYSLGVLNDE